jgi:hypothetical protein
MAVKTRPRLGIVTRRMRRWRVGDDPKLPELPELPGLAEAVEVYRRIVEEAGAPDHRSWRSPGRQRARAS